MNSQNKVLFLIIAGIIMTCIAPILFTRDWSSISFLNSGQIGDTIGGTTAPIIGILGAILVYLALKEQVKANTLIQEQILLEDKRETKRLDNIRELILWDLTTNIKAGLQLQSKEFNDGLSEFMDNKREGFFASTFTLLNLSTYESLQKVDLFSVFKDSFYDLAIIYHRVEGIKAYTFNNFLIDREKVYHETKNNTNEMELRLKLLVETYIYNSKVADNIQDQIEIFVNNNKLK